MSLGKRVMNFELADLDFLVLPTTSSTILRNIYLSGFLFLHEKDEQIFIAGSVLPSFPTPSLDYLRHLLHNLDGLKPQELLLPLPSWWWDYRHLSPHWVSYYSFRQRSYAVIKIWILSLHPMKLSSSDLSNLILYFLFLLNCVVQPNQTVTYFFCIPQAITVCFLLVHLSYTDSFCLPLWIKVNF